MLAVLSPRAQKQLYELESYLAGRFYPRDAERFVNRLTEACRSLAITPHQGTRRDDLRPGIRSTGFERRVLIYFKVSQDRLIILSVLYRGKRPSKRELSYDLPGPF